MLSIKKNPQESGFVLGLRIGVNGFNSRNFFHSLSLVLSFPTIFSLNKLLCTAQFVVNHFKCILHAKTKKQLSFSTGDAPVLFAAVTETYKNIWSL
jgi:hypothetical protein